LREDNRAGGGAVGGAGGMDREAESMAAAFGGRDGGCPVLRERGTIYKTLVLVKVRSNKQRYNQIFMPFLSSIAFGYRSACDSSILIHHISKKSGSMDGSLTIYPRNGI
jgi:hypothetical protein